MRKWNDVSTSGAGEFKTIPALLGSVKHLTRSSAKANEK